MNASQNGFVLTWISAGALLSVTVFGISPISIKLPGSTSTALHSTTGISLNFSEPNVTPETQEQINQIYADQIALKERLEKNKW